MSDQNLGLSPRMSLQEFKSRHPDPDNIAVQCPKCEKASTYGLLENRSQDELKKWKCPHCNRCNAATAMIKLNKELDVFRWMEGQEGWAGEWFANASETLRSLQSLTGSAAPSPAVLSNPTNYFEHASQSRGGVPQSAIVVSPQVNHLQSGSQDRGMDSEASSPLYMHGNHTPGYGTPGLGPVGSRDISRDGNLDTGGLSMLGGSKIGTGPGQTDEMTRGRSMFKRGDIGKPYRDMGRSKTSGGVGAAAGPLSYTGLGATKNLSAPHGRFAFVSQDTSEEYLMSGARSPGTSPDKNTKKNRDSTHVEGGDNDGLLGAEGEGKTLGAEAEAPGDTGSRGSRHSSTCRGSSAVFSTNGSEK